MGQGKGVVGDALVVDGVVWVGEDGFMGLVFFYTFICK
jgi:hypothetical protein